jgi:hypothetical protein
MLLLVNGKQGSEQINNRAMHEKLQQQIADKINRRSFLAKASLGLGSLALGSLLGPQKLFSSDNPGGILNAPHIPPKAKRVVYLFQSGGPSQLELFDYKPLLREMHGKDLPDSVRKGSA